MNNPAYEAVVIGASAGGIKALFRIFETLPEDYALPFVIVIHRMKDENTLLEELMSNRCKIPVKQAEEKEKIKNTTVYFAPPNYHLLIESDRTFSLSCYKTINFSRPSIDVLFETAAQTYNKKLLGIILTGANHDGAKGISAIHQHGGTTIAQHPKEAECPTMPQASIDTGCVDHILELNGICQFLITR